ncbi:uncharacterized protein LOC123007774 [Tribolium madens]|uniref:uncharacterized protein LOC123007774 n=1 Tax=Tribolium madens TaxID=41895 RepID=UPI001CF74A7E|nr:uncharacterized protein LOC123007774 [Tribolium madens]
MSSVNEQLAPPPKPRLSPLEFRNTDLVSRLLAATPPYLYNMSLLPNTYFFSEMLRSFVQAKSDPSPRNFQPRRTRKRPWSTLKTDNSPKLEQNFPFPEHKPNETPLELTTKLPTLDNDDKSTKSYSTSTLQDQEPIYPALAQETSPSGLILPPPPPIWYPPLYPTSAPYGIDPLHFFIDLRVSGHIYDRKNQREETSSGQEDENRKVSVKTDQFKPSRHASAFSVPTPRLNRTGPINLSHGDDYNRQETKNIKFDVKSMGFEKTSNKIGTSYIMNNISNIYKNVNEEAQKYVKNEENDNETEEEKEKRVKDLRALIGLELVVDYMNHAKPQPKRLTEENNLMETESVGSPTLEVVAVHDES